MVSDAKSRLVEMEIHLCDDECEVLTLVSEESFGLCNDN